MLGIFVFVFFFFSFEQKNHRDEIWYMNAGEMWKKLCTPSLEWLDVSPESLRSTPLKNQPIFVSSSRRAHQINEWVQFGKRTAGKRKWGLGEMRLKERQNEKLVVQCRNKGDEERRRTQKYILQPIFRAKRSFTASRISNKPTDSAKKPQQKLLHFAPYPSFTLSLPFGFVSAFPSSAYVLCASEWNEIECTPPTTHPQPPSTTHTHTHTTWRLHNDELRIQFVHGWDYALFSAVAAGFTSILFRLRLCFSPASISLFFRVARFSSWS